MFRSAGVAAFISTLLTVSASSGQLPLRDVTGDGMWDCKDSKGEYAGSVVLAETTYAYIKPDGRVGGYGKVYIITEGLDLPLYAMVSGYFKDQMRSQGFGMRGPKANPHKLDGELFLNVILSPGGDGALDWDCVRRKAPAA